MAVMRSKDGNELLIDCNCGCGEGIRFKIDKEDEDCFCFMSYMNSKFYTEQCEGMWRVFCKKLKKIWYIIRNKDFHYSDLFITKNEFNEFKKYISEQS